MAKKTAAILLDILILLLAAIAAFLANRYLEHPTARVASYIGLGAGCIALLSYEIYGFITGYKERMPVSDIPRSLSLLGSDEKVIRSWELIGRVNVLIGKSAGEILADVDLTGSDFAELLEPSQTLLQYAETGWWARSFPTRNGNRVVRKGKDILLAPGVPVRLQRGDLLVLAEEIRLALD